MAPSKRRPARSSSGRPATKKGRSWLVVLPLVLGGILLVLLVRRQEPPPAESSSAHDEAPRLRLSALAIPEPEGLSAVADVEPDLAALRLERAQRTLDSYVQATKYPPTSRPLSEHPDQIEPLNKVDHRQLLVRGGQSRLRLRYDRSVLVGDDAVMIRLSGEDSVGNPLPCEIVSANATEAPTHNDTARSEAIQRTSSVAAARPDLDQDGQDVARDEGLSGLPRVGPDVGAALRLLPLRLRARRVRVARHRNGRRQLSLIAR